MLLGCCHCGQTPPPPSESIPPSESVPSVSESSPSIMGERWDCSACTILPVRWRVTGIERSRYTFSSASGYSSPWTDCPSMFEPLDLVFDVQFAPPGVPPSSTTNCQRWVSTQNVINSSRDRCVPAPCAAWSPSCQQALFTGSVTRPRGGLTLRRGNMFGRQPTWQFVWNYAFQDGASNAVSRTLVWTATTTVDIDGNCVKPIVMSGGGDNTLNSAYLGVGYDITLTPS